MRNILLLAPVALLALSGCGDNGAKEQAAEAARAKAAEARKARDLQDGLALNIGCHSAIKRQEALLNSPVPVRIAGGAAPYLSYYRDMIAKKLGDTVIPAEGDAPELSAANLDAYLAHAAGEFGKNIAENGNRAQHLAQVTTCIQSGSEFGAGPLSKISPGERIGQMHQLRGLIEQLGK